MVIDVLKNKLMMLGYSETVVISKLKNLDLSSLDGNINDVEVLEFSKPKNDIVRFFVNMFGNIIGEVCVDGEYERIEISTSMGVNIPSIDYALDKRLCAVIVTESSEVKILNYIPSDDIKIKYAGQHYEALFAKDRRDISEEYFNALIGGGRVSASKGKEIIYMLLRNFVIDEIVIGNLNPRLKLYDNADKYAEALTSYELKYINRSVNKIEIAVRNLVVKQMLNDTKLGFVSNDPYLKIDEINNYADFAINRASYVWFSSNASGMEEIAIFTAKDSYTEKMYREYRAKQNGNLEKKAQELAGQFGKEIGYSINNNAILEVLKKLNRELIFPSMDIIKSCIGSDDLNIEPLKYRFRFISDASDFESRLYNSIEDNIGRRYKYRYVESIADDSIVIGNKLNYTDLAGQKIIKQSIADFNMSSFAAVVKRETFIDENSISKLLGYMYDDLESLGTDTLPVPSIEVDFYFPKVELLSGNVKMYNGTFSENVATKSKFFDIPNNKLDYIYREEKDLTGIFVLVRYLRDDGILLKENKIGNLSPGMNYVPEVIPIITDNDGKDWYRENSDNLSVIVTEDNSQNVIEIIYKKKMANIKISYINQQGKEIKKQEFKNMQVGEVLDLDAFKFLKLSDGVQWSMLYSTPERLVVSDKDVNNIITIVYDVIKADLVLKYINKSGQKIKADDSLVVVANQEYVANVDKDITDENGLVWTYISETPSKIMIKENVINELVLTYDVKKAKVLVLTLNENDEKIKDDVVSFIQIGKKYEIDIEKDMTDIDGKRWVFDSVNQSNIVVSEDEEKNKFILSYMPKKIKVRVVMEDEHENKIKEDDIVEAQIGSRYRAEDVGDVVDVSGRVWSCINTDENLLVSASEVSNKITFIYRPFMTNVSIRYLDDEGNQLLPNKTMTIQAGNKFKVEAVSMLKDDKGRGWILGKQKKEEHVASKFEEENIIDVFYDKQLVNIKLILKDLFGNVIHEDIDAKAQLGSEYNAYDLYEKVTSDSGERWMLKRTEPSKMFVKENSEFTLIYDELQAKVLVKRVNIVSSKAIVLDEVINCRIGSIFVPNIQQKIIDKNKRQWKFVGDNNINIVAKENEQQNIITLQYEPILTDVVIKFVNENGVLVREDIVKPEQIGADIEINKVETVIDEGGLNWKLKSMSAETIKVSENSSENVVTCTYEELKTNVFTKYIDDSGVEIITQRVDYIQIGKKFEPEVIDRILDNEKRLWIYSQEDVSPIIVKSDNNVVLLKYLPKIVQVKQVFVNKDKEEIFESDVTNVQVGMIVFAKRDEIVIDSEGRHWIFAKTDLEKIVVSEDVEKNVITHLYNPRLVNVLIGFKTDEGTALKSDDKFELQIGSKYNIIAEKYLKDERAFSWVISDKNAMSVVIKENEKDNYYEVIYEKYMINVYYRFVDEKDNEVTKPIVSVLQVGDVYVPEVVDQVIDESGAHWLQMQKGESRIFANTAKINPIKVTDNEEKNEVRVKYKPKLANVTINYLDMLGRVIKKEDVVKAQVGSHYVVDTLERIIDASGNKWSYNPKSSNSLIVSEDEKVNIVNLSYEEQKVSVTFKYQDEFGNRLRPPTKVLAQIGSVYVPTFENIIEDEHGRVWEYSNRNIDKLEVKDSEKENVILLTYVPLKVDVVLVFEDRVEKTIIPNEIVKAQLGSDFKPNINDTINDEESKLYKFVKSEPGVIKVKEKPIGEENEVNVITLTYEPVYSNVIIKYQDFDGNALKDDEKIQLQVGKKYVPGPIQYIKDKKDFQWELVNGDAEPIRVMEDEKSNVLKFVYEIAKAEIVVRYMDMDGNFIKADDHFNEQVGNDFVAKPEKKIVGKDNRQWSFLSVEPVKLKVGSINNIIKVTYQEAKTMVVIHYQSNSGEKLKEDEKVLVQIGSRFKPKASSKVIYDENEIWRFTHFVPDGIVVSENTSENEITQIYSNEVKSMKLEEEKVVENKFNFKFEPVEEVQLEDKVLEEKAEVKQEESKQQETKQEEVIFTNPHLIELERNIKLSLEEKKTIQKLSDYNEDIIKILRQNVEKLSKGEDISNDEISKIMDNEKHLIENDLKNVLSSDKTGSKFLKIYEYVIKNENVMTEFASLQQRKAVLITDYFMNKQLLPIEQITYICERGKNDIELRKIDEKISSAIAGNGANIREYTIIKVITLYEKAMLDNYYKARNIAKDNYFKDSAVKSSMSPEIVIGVANMLQNQALTLLKKCDKLSLMQFNELESIFELLNAQQIDSLKKLIEKIPDSKQRKLAHKILRELKL